MEQGSEGAVLSCCCSALSCPGILCGSLQKLARSPSSLLCPCHAQSPKTGHFSALHSSPYRDSEPKEGSCCGSGCMHLVQGHMRRTRIMSIPDLGAAAPVPNRRCRPTAVQGLSCHRHDPELAKTSNRSPKVLASEHLYMCT